MAKAKTYEITTESGFKVRIDPQIANDMEIIDEFTGIVMGTANTAPGELVKKMIGEAGQKALYEYCRNENGRVLADKVGVELNDILNKAAEMLKKK